MKQEDENNLTLKNILKLLALNEISITPERLAEQVEAVYQYRTLKKTSVYDVLNQVNTEDVLTLILRTVLKTSVKS